MNKDAITKYIATTFAGVDCALGSGNTFFIYDPNRNLLPNRRFPFATLVTNNAYDQASDLDRPGVFRLNIGVGKEAYRKLFGELPVPVGASGNLETGHDFTAIDQIMPHPIYAAQSWICVLSPSEQTFQHVRPLLAIAYEASVKRSLTGDAANEL